MSPFALPLLKKGRPEERCAAGPGRVPMVLFCREGGTTHGMMVCPEAGKYTASSGTANRPVWRAKILCERIV